jgi:hypothetical protein
VDLESVLEDVADALVAIDVSGVGFKTFQPGVGPYGEPQLVAEIARRLNSIPKYGGAVRTKRAPDMLIPGEWALEFKIARPFGDNGKQAENWSVNLLHPYPGNTSAIGDCLKLVSLKGTERKAVIVVGYEHDPPEIDLTPLIRAFEVVAADVMGIRLDSRVEIYRRALVHPIHRQARLCAWEVLDGDASLRRNGKGCSRRAVGSIV